MLFFVILVLRIIIFVRLYLGTLFHLNLKRNEGGRRPTNRAKCVINFSVLLIMLFLPSVDFSATF